MVPGEHPTRPARVGGRSGRSRAPWTGRRGTVAPRSHPRSPLSPQKENPVAPPTETRVHDIFDLQGGFPSTDGRPAADDGDLQGLHGHDGRWDDLSPAGGRAVIDFIAGYQQRLAALPPAEDPWARLACQDRVRAPGRWSAPTSTTATTCSTSTTSPRRSSPCAGCFDLMDTSTLEGWQNIASRLETIDAAVEGYRQALDRQGKTVAVRQVKATIEQGLNAGPTSYFHRYQPAGRREGRRRDARGADRGRRGEGLRRPRDAREVPRPGVPPLGDAQGRRRPRAPRHDEIDPEERTRGAGSRSAGSSAR